MAGELIFKNKSLFLLASVNDPDRIVDNNMLVDNHYTLMLKYLMITAGFTCFAAHCFDVLCTEQLLRALKCSIIEVRKFWTETTICMLLSPMNKVSTQL